jgi:hypothetical protein
LFLARVRSSMGLAPVRLGQWLAPVHQVPRRL